MTPTSPNVMKPVTGTCPFCGHEYLGSPSHCSRCGTIQEHAREKVREEGRQARRHLRFQRALADLFFLIGLLLGGPIMTFGGEIRLGLILVLAGGFASVLRRYTEWSNAGTVGIGVLSAAVIATAVVGSEDPLEEDGFAGEEARLAYLHALTLESLDIPVQARGPGSVTAWFYPPQVLAGECGTYPPPHIRAHLAELGFVRVVVAVQNQKGGMCSFRP